MVLFDASRFGAPIGMVTARDLLYTIVACKSDRRSTAFSNSLARSDHERMHSGEDVFKPPSSDSPICDLEDSADEVMLDASFKQPLRNTERVVNLDSGLYASGSSSESMTSGSTYSAHSESDRFALEPLPEGTAPPCGCACHSSVSETARPGVGNLSQARRRTVGATQGLPTRMDCFTSGRDPA